MSLEPKIENSAVINNYFVSTTVLFCFPVVLLLNQIGSNLKYGDWTSFLFLGIGAAVILRSYIVGFLSMNVSYNNRRWLQFICNLVLILATLWSIYGGLADLVVNSYPNNWLIGFTVANLLYLCQIWINRIYDNQYIQVQFLQIIVTMLSLGALWQLPFAGARWFQSLIAIILSLFELYLLIGVANLISHLDKNSVPKIAESIDFSLEK